MKICAKYIPFLFLPLLSGCPMGDRLDQRYKPAETASVALKNEQICFGFLSAEDYQPVFISIAPRNTPHKERWYQQHPRLSVNNGEMCIPTRVYKFPDKGQFVVSFTLESKEKAKATEFNTRRFDTAFEIKAGRATVIKVDNNEF
ncbi:putative T6SS immunity periplasmic lipoprotein [Kosakonia pseudosacchari]|uniref:putative T6SS immunity periplasmic lipoprotein n=1 Tax=Kosakonia pseudosacchari TaxID=1646340 RepID=UPI001142C738|nr:putative T6SS immunity periplasmic lipoprotein [Kosakonia pseudosacchari]